MNDQEYMAATSMNPSSGGRIGGKFSVGGGAMLPIIAAILGLGVIVLGVLTWHFATTAHTATSTLEAQKTAAAKAASTAQQKLDAQATAAANEVPFRAYDAPDIYGNFVINFPKNWSSWISTQSTGTQVVLIMNPDFVTVTSGVPAKAAAKVTLIQESGATFISQYAALIKTNLMQQTTITVSGQSGYNFTGKFPNQRSIREVMVPVRDSVLVFDSENAQYATQFNEILAQAKIVP